MRNNKIILALDFGGTKLAAASLLAGQQNFLSRAVAYTAFPKSSKIDRETMLSLARTVLKGARPSAIGVSFGGPVRENGVVVLSHHVSGWEDFPLSNWLSEYFDAPVAVENDANAAALGEWCYGAGQGIKYLFYATISTGIGGGIVIDGSIYRGADNLAGELGHMVIDPNGPLCSCGRKGCLEVLASGPAIARRVRELIDAWPSEGRILRMFAGENLQNLSAREVSAAAQLGDRLALAVLQAAGEAIGLGLAQVITLLNPERIVLGGGVIKAGTLLLEPIVNAAKKYAFPGARVEIVTSKLGDDAPLWGAAILAERLLR